MKGVNKILVFFRQPLFLLGALFVVLHLALWLTKGISLDLEAEKYISQGKILFERGGLSESKYVFYLPVILLVWLCHWLHISVVWVALFQVLLSAVGQYYFFRLVKANAGQSAALLASLLLLVFLPLQLWNFFLYTDSIFISLTLIYFWIIYRHAGRGWAGNLFVLLMLMLLVVSRPHGLLFIPPTFIYYLLLAPSARQRWVTVAAGALVLMVMFLFMNRIFTGGEDMDALKPFVEEHVICFVPQNPAGADLILQKTDSPVADIIYYAWHNPVHFLRLMALRLYSFFNLTRPYYSMIHNIGLLAFLIPMYLFALAGIRRAWYQQRPLVFFFILFLILYPMGITFQCDDWHSRFTMMVIPLFIFFAVYALTSTDIWKRNFSK